MEEELVTVAYVPDPQELPAWLSYSTYVTTLDGTVYTTQTVNYIPQTYWGPPIPLDSDWTYGGLTSPASTPLKKSTASETTGTGTETIGLTTAPGIAGTTDVITTLARSSTSTSSSQVVENSSSPVQTISPAASPSISNASSSSAKATSSGTMSPSSSVTTTPPISSSSINNPSPSSSSSSVPIPLVPSSNRIRGTDLILSILLPILFTVFLIGIITSCLLFRRGRRERRAREGAGTGGQYVMADDREDEGGNVAEMAIAAGMVLGTAGGKKEERERLNDGREDERDVTAAGLLDVEDTPTRKRWLDGVIPTALRRRTASARGRVPSNDAWSEEPMTEVDEIIGRSRDSLRDPSAGRREASDREQWHEYAYLGAALDGGASPQDGVLSSTLVNDPPQATDPPPDAVEGAIPPPRSLLGRWGFMMTPRVLSQNLRPQRSTLTNNTQSNNTSGGSDDPTAFGSPRPSELFFNVPSPPGTPPPPLSAGGTAMPDMSPFRDVPERYHFSLIYPDRMGNSGERTSLMTSDVTEGGSLSNRDEASRRINFPSPPPRTSPEDERPSSSLSRGMGEAEVASGVNGGDVLRPLDTRRFTGGSSMASSLPPSPAKPRPQPLHGAHGSHGERLLDPDASGNRPLSISAVGGAPTITPVHTPTSAHGAYLSTPESARTRSQAIDQSSRGRGATSLFRGRAPSGSSDPEHRLSMISYPGQPFIDESTYLRAMGMLSDSAGHDSRPGQGVDIGESGESGGSGSGGSGERRSGRRVFVARGPPLSAVQSRIASVASGNVDEFGQNLRPGAQLSTQVTQNLFPGRPISRSGSIHSHNAPNSSHAGSLGSGGSGDVDVEMLGTTYNAAALRGRRSMSQLIPTSEALSSLGHGSDYDDHPLPALPTGAGGRDEGHQLLPTSSDTGPGQAGLGRGRRSWVGRLWGREG